MKAAVKVGVGGTDSNSHSAFSLEGRNVVVIPRSRLDGESFSFVVIGCLFKI